MACHVVVLAFLAVNFGYSLVCNPLLRVLTLEDRRKGSLTSSSIESQSMEQERIRPVDQRVIFPDRIRCLDFPSVFIQSFLEY